MPVTFRDITGDNFEAVIALQVQDDQVGCVRTNLYSIAQSKAIPVLVPKAVYNESDELVGFVLYQGERDPDYDPDGWLVHVMVDKAYQGRGYGRATMLEMIRLVRDELGCTALGLSVEPHNHGAMRLYRSLGFKDAGRKIGEEVVLKLTFESQDETATKQEEHVNLMESKLA